MARLNLGRRKIPMRRMSNESHLLVTFSKRRAGLFKKASELCTLCGVEIAIIVFSPGNKKVFSFGHPNLELVIDKFILPGQNSNPTGVLQLEDPQLAQLSGHLSTLDDQLKTQTAYGERLENERRQRQVVDWFEAPVEDLELEQLQMLKSRLTKLKTLMENSRNNLSMSSEGGEPADGYGAAFGVMVTPQGYALC